MGISPADKRYACWNLCRAGDVDAEFCKTGTSNQADITSANYGNMHLRVYLRNLGKELTGYANFAGQARLNIGVTARCITDCGAQ